MDKDRVLGIGKKVAGSLKEGAGKATGDLELEAKGAAEKTTGKAQAAAGRAKDSVRDAVKK